MSAKRMLVETSVRRYRLVTVLVLVLTLLVVLVAALPSFSAKARKVLNAVEVDTDPENMLSADEPVRVFHDRMKKELSLHDMVVVGIVNEVHPDGVFNPVSLSRIYELTEYAKTLQWRGQSGQWEGVIESDMIAPSLVDSMEPGGAGEVRFEWLMREPPRDAAGALEVRRKAQRIPFLNDTLVSGDGKAVALYLPLTRKDLSHRVYQALNAHIPSLWMLAPLKARLESRPSTSALVALCRLMAYQSRDSGEFEANLSQLASAVRSRDFKNALVSAEIIADKWASDGTLPAGPEGTRYVPGDIDDLLTELARPRGVPRGLLWEKLNARVAVYFLASKSDSGLSDGELVTQLSEFFKEIGGSVPESADFQGRESLARLITSALREGARVSPDRCYITGLPVAEDTFGAEMFVQMAISAPTAMLVIFILMIVFFRKLIVIVSPLVVALVSVIITMGVLVIAGFPIHIMSSMIPIFIMPIAVLDSIHIISEFFEEYQKTRDPRATILSVMGALFVPMLYTSLTSAAGFASLALTPIPPVQVFGVFVAVGIMAAWLLTVTFIPAFVMFIPRHSLENFGAHHGAAEGRAKGGARRMARFLHHLGLFTNRAAKPILAAALVVMVIAGYGISRIEVNDNPVKWFTKAHPIREADRVMNEHFGGTYMAYLAMRAREGAFDAAATAAGIAARAREGAGDVRAYFSDEAPVEEIFAKTAEAALAAGGRGGSREEFFDGLSAAVSESAAGAAGEAAFVWEEALSLVEAERQAASELLKDPAVLGYQADIQRVLGQTGVVGKSNSLADIVKTVHRELLSSGEADADREFRIPENRRMVAETLIQFQNSHRPGDLWHFVTPDYRTASIWMQLKSGDNRDMSRVKAAVDEFTASYPPPALLDLEWFGLTYINVVWQEKMVTGMLEAFAGSFLVVFLLMAILFRSPLWGLLSMIPLTVTIAAIYGATGLVGKDYDMPVAVLSSLTLGLAVDFAIHFLARTRAMYGEHGSWERTCPHVFAEPARAISRNIIVIAAGFLPLLLAPLVPYRTVGLLLATILLVSGAATLVLLPALVRLLERRLFALKGAMGPACNCALCIASSAALVLVIALAMKQYVGAGWTGLTVFSLVAIPVLSLVCGIISRREKCRVAVEDGEKMPEEEEDEAFD